MGRPREFDEEQVVEAALEVFWRHGYEGASLTDLTEAMGITRPSLYATFGSKEGLFQKALERYGQKHLAFSAEALRAPAVRDAVEQWLLGFADAHTAPDQPAGCLGVNAAIACGEASEPVRQEALRFRRAGEVALARRLEQARAEGELPPDSSPTELARFVMTVCQGMAVQATAGTSRAALRRVAQMALTCLPLSPKGRRAARAG
ncbi:TetR/AcrR family transcriptional regulator [Pyxidicoccus fallax]|uniref:TetR/AcrR family transcriptional regulator n=1 Tax=Pyxidicoccus fallax TaxID=394095 RepID=A0A848LE99_9BACT|nr:TetR/AcrR family transcriptional regulator [Pyxidicoccus fallax]NMO13778.1 TetR/AcrR family transcriptional regulator [Pyxidicoccus fallax]NPC77035.1 TetR/AcrR family transcriptional regulator [Pyxidicoccus fallax]